MYKTNISPVFIMVWQMGTNLMQLSQGPTPEEESPLSPSIPDLVHDTETNHLLN